MKVLVTGAPGFLGHLLTAAPEGQGHEVIGVDCAPDTKAELRIGFNELDLERGPAAGVAAVVHLACMTQPATSDAALALDIAENVGASAEFFRRCAEAGVGRVVLASSGGTTARCPRVRGRGARPT
jgi:nucleoside-diphosphate-sugar epimerase